MDGCAGVCGDFGVLIGVVEEGERADACWCLFFWVCL